MSFLNIGKNYNLKTSKIYSCQVFFINKNSIVPDSSLSSFSLRYSDEEIDVKVETCRQRLLKDLELRLANGKEEVLMEAKEREMLKMEEAFGIRKGTVEGSAFKFDSEIQKKERHERITQEEKARRYRPY